VKVQVLFLTKRESSPNKECFVNLFYGNNMKIKPVLLSAYTVVLAEIIILYIGNYFEQVETLEQQNEKQRTKK
jgi:hypothetical protein